MLLRYIIQIVRIYVDERLFFAISVIALILELFRLFYVEAVILFLGYVGVTSSYLKRP